MTTFAQAVQVVYARITGAWAALLPAVPYAFENEAYQPATSGSWIRVVVRPDTANQGSMGVAGSRRFIRRDRVVAQLFTPLDLGVAAAASLIGGMRTVFEGVRDGGITFEACTARPSDPDPPWFLTIAEVPFRYLETK